MGVPELLSLRIEIACGLRVGSSASLAGRSSDIEVLAPDELNLVRQSWIRDTVDSLERTTLPFIEAAGEHVDVLGLCEKPTTLPASCPLLRGDEERSPDSRTAVGWRHAQIPQHARYAVPCRRR